MDLYKKIALKIILYLFLTEGMMAQDFHFSQYQMAPLYVNPALTGYLQGYNNRIAIKYRNQWSSFLQDDAYQTKLVSYDGRICLGRSFLGYGLNAVLDESGTPSFRTTQLSGSISYHLPMGKTTYFSAGLQAGNLQYSVDQKSLFFEEQFDGVFSFDPSSSNEENFDDFNSNLLDIGGGILLYDTKKGWHIGLGMHHTSIKPRFNFTTNNTQDLNKVNIRAVVHGAYPVPSSSKIQFIPRGLAMIQWPHWQAVVGADFKMSLTNKSDFFPYFTIGTALRSSSNKPNSSLVADAVLLSIATGFSNNFTFGFSYDLNISSLNAVSGFRGGMEFSLMYQFTVKEKNACVYCPSF